jgi:diacylglycerol kinase family enzyme
VTGFAVVNPRSAGGARDLPDIERALRAIYPRLGMALTQRRGEATALVRRALSEGFSEIIAVGGDGTINEAVNGFFGPEGPIAPDSVFAFATSGTGGDFRKTFALPAAYATPIARLKNAAVRPIDVGRLSCVSNKGEPVVRYFVNVGSFGLSGQIVSAVHRARFAKLFGERFAFRLHSTLARLAYREPVIRIRIDGDYDEIARITTVAVANGQYFGDGVRIAPAAKPDDGFFDMVIVGGGHRAAGDLDRLYRGEHLDLEDVRALRGRKLMAAPVAETHGRAVLVEVDGESVGRLPASFDILPRALNLRC